MGFNQRAISGHKTLTVTQVYAEKNVEAARRVMGEASARRGAKATDQSRGDTTGLRISV